MNLRKPYHFKEIKNANEINATPPDTTACPRCNCKMSKVLETRNIMVDGGYLTIRVRLCRHCGKRFRTKEVVDANITMPSGDTTRSKQTDLDIGPVFPE